jgi:hypothetical protein
MIWDAGLKTSELAASAIIDSAIGTPLLLMALQIRNCIVRRF